MEEMAMLDYCMLGDNLLTNGHNLPVHSKAVQTVSNVSPLQMYRHMPLFVWVSGLPEELHQKCSGAGL